MSIAALSPSSVLATPIQANPQIRGDLQASVPQVAQDAQKAATAAQTDTITISSQALKLADEKSAAAKASAGKADEKSLLQAASDKSYADKSSAQKDAVKAYSAFSSN